MGLVHKEPDTGTMYLYTDLICATAKYRGTGKMLLMAVEAYGKEIGCDFVALRASKAALLNTYRRYGYRRQPNACLPRSRAERYRLREMDNDRSIKYKAKTDHRYGEAVEYRGAKKYDAAGRVRESGYDASWVGKDGWWMSKCIA